MEDKGFALQALLVQPEFTEQVYHRKALRTAPTDFITIR